MLLEKKKIQNKISINKHPFSIIAFVLIFIYTASLVLALLWALGSSFKGTLEFKQGLFDFPKHIFKYGMQNYINSITEISVEVEARGGGTRPAYMWELFINTFLFAGGCTIVATMVPCIVAYIVAKYRFPGRNIIYSCVIVAMLLPIVGALPSEMMIVRALGFYDNLIGMWLLKGTFLGMYFLVYYAAFKSLSWEYAEAAFIDGASHLRVMFKIMIPLITPTIMAVGLLYFIGFWNEYQTQLIYLPSMPSVSYALWQTMLGGGSTSNAGSAVPVQFAGCIIVSVPTLVLFVIFKDKLMGNLAVGGIKG